MTTEGAVPHPASRYSARGLNILMASSLVPVAVYLFSFLGDWFFLAEMLVNFRLQMLVLLTPFLAASLVFRRWRWSLVVGLAAIGCAISLAPAWIPAAQPLPGPVSIRLMSFNLLGGNQAVESVLAEIHRTDPDILVILELSPQWASRLQQLDATLKPVVVEPKLFGNGVAVYSRLKVVSSDVRRLAEETTDCPAADVVFDVAGQPLRLLGVHFISPVHIHQNSLGGTIRQSQMKLDLRNREMADAAGLVARSSVPTVMAGDFNCTPFSGSFGRLTRTAGLRDSRRGWGYQGTFPEHTPYLRIPIDHVLVSREIHVIRRATGQGSGSDHLPVVCDFSITVSAPEK